jgi:hypothetical protein
MWEYFCKVILSIDGITLKASLKVLNMWPYTLKLDEEKWKHAGLVQEMDFLLHICTICKG